MLYYAHTTQVNTHQGLILKFTKLDTKSPKSESLHETKPIRKNKHKRMVLNAHIHKHGSYKHRCEIKNLTFALDWRYTSSNCLLGVNLSSKQL